MKALLATGPDPSKHHPTYKATGVSHRSYSPSYTSNSQALIPGSTMTKTAMSQSPTMGVSNAGHSVYASGSLFDNENLENYHKFETAKPKGRRAAGKEATRWSGLSG